MKPHPACLAEDQDSAEQMSPRKPVVPQPPSPAGGTAEIITGGHPCPSLPGNMCPAANRAPAAAVVSKKANSLILKTPNGPQVRLLPGRAVLLEDGDGCGPWLVVADVHLGKSATFRARGLAVPEGDTAQDLAALLRLARRHSVARVVVNGDLFHAPAGITPELEAAVSGFSGELGVPLTLVTGNHDAKIRRLPAGVESVPFLDFAGGIRLVHDPAETAANAAKPPKNGTKDESGPLEPDAGFYLTGHWHPVVRIADGKRTSLRLPCFLLRGGRNLILPAFGSFTGGAMMKPELGDRFFVAPGDRVIEVPEALLR